MRIWTLDDGIPGHWSMTAGLVRLIRDWREVDETRIRVDWRWGGARQAFQRAERAGLRVPAGLFRMMADFDPPPSGVPDLIVSRGGATLFANAWLARENRCPNVFIGTVRKMPAELFSAVILYQDAGHPAPYFAMPLFPTRIDPSTLPTSAAAFPWSRGKPGGSVAAMILGGDGSGYHYSMDDWRSLAKGMRHLSETTGVRWCVTSSRRTPVEAERLLESGLRPETLAESCWWHAGDRRPCLDAFLGVAEMVFCTEDSMSMLEECIAGGAKVVSLAPLRAKPNGFFSDYLAQRVRVARLRRLALGAFENHAGFAQSEPWNPIPPNAMRDSAGELLGFLGL
jgi:mitochondrial fission protein ELM1